MPQLKNHAVFGQLPCLTAWALVGLLSGSLSAAEPALARDFNGPDTVWQVTDDDRVGRVLSHECVPGGARDSAGVERIVVAAPSGQSVQLGCPSAPVAVIDELEIRIWVKASRPDIQLAARVALPRSTDRDGELAVTAIVRGTRYDRPGHWQQLVLSGVPKLLAAQIRIMRSTPGAKIDPREAFVDEVVLVIPGEPHGVAIETDDLVVDGVVRTAIDDIQLASYPSPPGAPLGRNSNTPVPASLNRLPDITSAAANSGKGTVRLQGDLLLIDDKPFVPRAIEWQREPLQFLAERGFNVVWLDQSPNAQQFAEAKRHGLWFVCRPPRPEALSREGLGAAGDRVIAWYLEDGAIESDPNYARRWTELVRERDTVSGRPVIMAPNDHWTSTGKTADVLLARRPRLGFTSRSDYDEWLASRVPLVRPGTPIWTCFATQYGPAVGQQISALSGVSTTAPNIEAQQLQSLVQTACTRGIRGFVFNSDSPLNETDPATRVRAGGLELINRRLQRLEPWLAAGNVVGRFPSADAGWSAVVLHVDRARLLILVADTTAALSPTKSVSFVVPGVPESCQVFALSPVALKTMPSQRVAGGTRFVFRPDDGAFVLMTEDPKVVQSLRQLIARDGARIVHLERDRAALEAASVADTARRLSQLGLDTNSAAQAAAAVNAQLQQVDAALVINRIEQAYDIAVAANQSLVQPASELRRSVSVSPQLASNPLAIGNVRLAEFAAFQRAQTALRGGDNLLYGGDFEDLGQMTQIGWQHFRDPIPGVESRAELSTVEPRHGNYCLALTAAAASGGSALDSGGSAVWIESPPIALAAGQVLEIAGWARVDGSPRGSDDGLQVVDSLGGPELSLIVRKTNGWERFSIVRAVSEATELRLTFALTGVGSARLDAIMVRALEQLPASRLPVLAPANGAPATTPSAAAGPLFVTPQTR